MAQLNKALFSSAKEDWETPQDFFDALDREFHFTLDPCADDKNAKCKTYFTKEENGLSKDWGGPFSVLQSAIRAHINGGMDQKVLRRRTEAGNGGCRTHTGADRHKVFSRIHIPQSGNSVHKRAASLRREQRRRAFPFYGGCIREGSRQ